MQKKVLLQDSYEFESRWLAPYACFSKNSRGRHYYEEPHPYRPPFERDRERIIHSTAFRRLQYKTQVFVNHEGDHYRTRMSHTLEVATVSRAIARVLHLNIDLSEAISLAHDLGHTPFGHTGEEVLNELTIDVGGFDHNKQSLRIVEYLEKRYPKFQGLNLTFETREGIEKHHTRYDSPSYKKNLLWKLEKMPSLEAQVVNIADELAYTSHDIDDGLYSGILNMQELKKGFPLWGEICENVLFKCGNVEEEVLRAQCIKALINILATDVISESQKRIEKANPQDVDSVRLLNDSLISFSSDMEEQLGYASNFLLNNMYRHYKVLRMATKAKFIIESLFRAYCTEPNQLPKTSRERLNNNSVKRVIADYIAGMTDRYAILEYRKLYDPYEKLL